ncbi:actin, clone 302 [Aplysia californica]|uniref:Actin, clone 302 n=1 Tax=Aplysia californica TaxID=6500 RepID=A0ABM1VY88_APLCA|nr:actin, clone 302 [Aplysia californica]
MSTTSTSSEDDFKAAIVLDNGSHRIRAGFAGDDAPRCFIRTVLCHSCDSSDTENADREDFYVGDHAMIKREILSLKCPIEYGIVSNWDDMEKIWDYVFQQELRVPSDYQPILVTEPPLNPKANREMMAQVMFETFNVPHMHVSAPAVLAFYANGRNSGIVLDIGETVTHVMASYESTFFPNATKRVDIGGKDLTEHLQKMLMEKGHSFTTPSELQDIGNMKERMCYVRHSKNSDLLTNNFLTSCPEKQFTLPDGKSITVTNEQFMCPEALFSPSLMGSEFEGIHTLVHESLMCCAVDTRPDMLVNVLLSGGSTMFQGLNDRMLQELKVLISPKMKLKVIAPPERKASVWIGGSILASLSFFQNHFISKSQYEEHGPYVMHRCV